MEFDRVVVVDCDIVVMFLALVDWLVHRCRI